jgi:osmotically-inducible protein OsmY
MLKLLFGAAAGFAAAWFLDPNDGTRRRHVLRDKATSYARKGKQEAVRKADYAAGQAKGAASTVTPSVRPPAEERLNDPALASKVESEVFRDEDIPKDKINVNVEHGVVYLRGEVPDRELMDELVTRTGKVEGVQGVENLTHVAGSQAS